MSTIGFIGLGIMGRPMAAHLVAGGHSLFLHDLAPVPQALLDQGAVACGSAREAAERAEVVITMVPDTPHVEAVLFGPGGVAEGLSPGKVVVDMSSISPLAT
jgi:2-hydroxy-3-oxopropionate reductase